MASNDPPTDDDAIAKALRLIQDALFALGSDGDDCIQALVAAQASLAGDHPGAARRAILRAFLAGLGSEEIASWADPRLRSVFATGAKVARLNEAVRMNSRLNVGPFDQPRMQAALEKAASSIAG